MPSLINSEKIFCKKKGYWVLLRVGNHETSHQTEVLQNLHFVRCNIHNHRDSALQWNKFWWNDFIMVNLKSLLLFFSLGMAKPIKWRVFQGSAYSSLTGSLATTREKFCSTFWVSLYIYVLYIFTSHFAQNREKWARWGRLLLLNCPLGWALGIWWKLSSACPFAVWSVFARCSEGNQESYFFFFLN